VRHAVATAGLALGLACAALSAAERGAAEIVLFDAPRGAWLGSVRADAALVVLEERDGWKRVRLEGWVRGSAATDVPGPSGSASPVLADVPVVPPSPSRQASVQGVLVPDLKEGGTPGGGVLVLLVRDTESLGSEHRRAGAECRSRLETEDRTLEGLRKDAEKSLNSSDNFREASSRSDQAKRKLAAEQKARRDLVKECRARAQAVFEKEVAARAISDPAGRFEFQGVAPGRYRAVAFETTGDSPRVWSYTLEVEGGGPRVLDPAADRSPEPADWGLR